MYRTLKTNGEGNFFVACPTCNGELKVRNNVDLTIVLRCPHFARRWRVTGDRRIRAEFRETTTPAAAST